MCNEVRRSPDGTDRYSWISACVWTTEPKELVYCLEEESQLRALEHTLVELMKCGRFSLQCRKNSNPECEVTERNYDVGQRHFHYSSSVFFCVCVCVLFDRCCDVYRTHCASHHFFGLICCIFPHFSVTVTRSHLSLEICHHLVCSSATFMVYSEHTSTHTQPGLSPCWPTASGGTEKGFCRFSSQCQEQFEAIWPQNRDVNYYGGGLKQFTHVNTWTLLLLHLSEAMSSC